MKQNKLNVCLLGLFAIFGLGAAQGVTVKCDPVLVKGEIVTKGSKLKDVGEYPIYIKFEYEMGKVLETTNLKIIRVIQPGQDKIVQEFDKFSKLDFIEGAPSAIEAKIKVKGDENIIKMAHQNDNIWKVNTAFLFDWTIDSKHVHGIYIGDMTCKEAAS
ncbi:MAG: hypothetical protein K0R14_1782 [Burkholderiales bacterium]|jgi:hypothetical protein|nr:hypothetical protein [Burkholderiales bacterium]